jgi:hypothetical protein
LSTLDELVYFEKEECLFIFFKKIFVVNFDRDRFSEI